MNSVQYTGLYNQYYTHTRTHHTHNTYKVICKYLILRYIYKKKNVITKTRTRQILYKCGAEEKRFLARKISLLYDILYIYKIVVDIDAFMKYKEKRMLLY